MGPVMNAEARVPGFERPDTRAEVFAGEAGARFFEVPFGCSRWRVHRCA
jgi:hypothetical protein